MKRSSALSSTALSWLRSNNFWVIVLLFIGLAIRSYAFGSLPPGLNQDEASTAYDAWSVLHYGIDRNGFHLPMMFVSWGSGMYALNGYLAWPFMLVGGLNALTIRLPFLLFGIVSLIAFFTLAKRIFNTPFALLALFFLVINPWHIMISRWALDSNLLPAVFLLGVLALVAALKRPKLLPLATALFALCPYLYGTAYVVVPVFLLLAGVSLRVLWKFPWKILLKNAVLFAVLTLPIGLYIAINHFGWNSIELPFMSIPRLSGPPRFHTVSTIFTGNPGSLWQDTWHNLVTLWDLLLTQDDGLSWNRIMPYGMYYPIGLPFILIGLAMAVQTVWQKRGKHPVVFMLHWTIACIAVALLQPVNINRMNIFVLPLVFFLAYGVWIATKKHSVVLTSIVSIFALYFLAFSQTYFTEYEQQAKNDFFFGLGDALTMATQHTAQPICVTDHANMPYIYALMAERTPPQVFADSVVYNNPGQQFQSVRSFGRFIFGLSHCADGLYDAYVIHQDEKDHFPNHLFIRHDFHNYAVAIPRNV